MIANKNLKLLRLRKPSAVLLFALTFLFTVFLSNSWGNDQLDKFLRVSAQVNNSGVYYVSPSGNDNNPGTSAQPWKTINYAVSQKSPVKPGNTILVQPGTYTEIIDIGKSGDSTSGNITLKANGNVTLQDPDPSSNDFGRGVIHSSGKSYWVIDGFLIQNTGWAGIALQDAKNMIVQNNHTYETGASGIIILPASYFGGGDQEVTCKNVKVLNNIVERANWKWLGSNYGIGTQEAMSIWGVDGFEVANNTLNQGNREGIDLKVGTRNGSVHDNSVTQLALIEGTPRGYNGGSAIYLDGNRANMFNIDVYNNLVFNNTADAITIADEDPSNGDVSDIRVYNNVVYGNGQLRVNGGAGTQVTTNVRNVKIINNTYAKNVQAIEIHPSGGGYAPHDILVRNNIFADDLYRHASFQSVTNLTVDDNLYTSQFNVYEDGGGNGNVTAWSNTKVPSAGFVNEGGNDFHLSSTSPAINLGSWDIGMGSYPGIEKDKDGKLRKAGVDLGAYLH
ncbi:MAG: right-handed parallel beta-helix repeat-containing protein [Stigonema ocellatum SAG 48.90 = DSM 106950]|nr:right-handed parallel beta-helix repeat-containing protein [Stigonema ocellatum SAG 48.90 = DSM 106950]